MGIRGIHHQTHHAELKAFNEVVPCKDLYYFCLAIPLPPALNSQVIRQMFLLCICFFLFPLYRSNWVICLFHFLSFALFSTSPPPRILVFLCRAFTVTAIAQMCVLGLMWVFGALLFRKEAVVEAYIFTIFNSLQGALVFLLHCLLSKQVELCVCGENGSQSSIYTLYCLFFSPDVLLRSAGERGVRPFPLLHLHSTQEEILRLRQYQSLQ